MNEPLILRRVIHPQARDNYGVIWNGIEVGSLGLQVGASGRTFWHWGIDVVLPPPRDFATYGDTMSRDDAMANFRKPWDQFSADADDRPARFVEMKQPRTPL
jgi:hypothetical protein